MSDAQRVVIVSPNWLGDAVMALPAIQDVRRHFGSARIIVAARPSVAPLFSLVPAVDEVLTLEWKGRVTAWPAMRRDVARVATASAGVALLLTNSFATAWLVTQAGIPERFGYRRDWRGPLLTRAVQRPKGSRHQAAYYQHLTTALDIPAGPLEPELAVPPDALVAARGVLRSAGWDEQRPIVVLAPGAAYGKAKQWPPAHFAALVARLVTESEVHCVLVGSGADARTTAEIVHMLDREGDGRIIDLAGRTTLQTLAGVLSLASACVSNDSGAMHLAAAAGAPVAALFGPTREHETAPLTRSGGRAEVLTNPVWCRPCMLRECPLDHRCMRGLDPARVFTAVSDIMNHESRITPRES